MSLIQRELIDSINFPGPASIEIVEYGFTKKRIGINVAKIGDFYQNYCAAHTMENANLSIGELIKDKKTLPLIGNFVLKFGSFVDTKTYIEDFVTETLKCYQNLIESLLDDPDEKTIICFVLVSDVIDMSGEYYATNIRFQFPYCQFDRSFYNEKFKPNLIAELRSANVVRCFSVQPIGDWNDIITDFRDSIPMYGSKYDDLPPTKFYNLYSYTELEPLEIGESFQRKDFSFCKRGFFSFDDQDEEEEEDHFEAENFIPIFLSIYFHDGVCIPRIENNTSVHSPRVSFNKEDISSDDPVAISRYLIPMISKKRLEKENYWIDIGKVLFSIYNGDREGVEEWKRISAGTKHPSQDCEKFYRRFHSSNLTIKTLAWYARQDSPDIYEQWHTQWYEDALFNSLECTNGDVAELVYRALWLRMFYSDKTKIKWWIFKNHHLVGSGDIGIRTIINKEIIPIYERYRLELYNKIYDPTLRMDEKKKLEGDGAAASKVIKNLKTENFLNSLISACRCRFNVEDFDKYRDADADKMACNNCIIEVCNNRVYIRDGKPEDYMTITTGINYRKDYTINHPDVKNINRIINQMMGEIPEMCHYFWKFNASLIRGRNLDKIFPILCGEGNNGKSIYAKIVQYAFGGYSMEFPVELISAKGGQSGAARPELKQAQGMRVTMISEPDESKIKSNIVKKYTGNDRLWFRGLFEDGQVMEQFYKFILLCNSVPDFTDLDQAMINRVAIMAFIATFVDDAPEDPDEQRRTLTYKVDRTLESQMEDLGVSFLWCCVNYFDAYISEGLIQPSIMKEVNSKFWDEHDPYICFIKERMQKIDRADISVGATMVFKAYQSWYSTRNGKRLEETLPAFVNHMKIKKRLGPHKDYNWQGWVIKEEVAAAKE